MQEFPHPSDMGATAAEQETIPDRFRSFAAVTPDRLALRSRWEQITFGELDRRASAVAAALQARGIGADCRVGVLATPCGNEAVAFLGILKTGALYVSLDPAHPLRRTRLILADCQPSLLLYDGPHRSLACSLSGSDLPIIGLDEVESEMHGGWTPPPIDPASPASIKYSSGSTGHPKGILHTHRSTLALGKGATERTIHPEEKVLVTGSTIAFNRILLRGACSYPWLLLEDGLDALADWIERHQISVFLGVPSGFRVFAQSLEGKCAVPSLRRVILTGETLYRKDVELLRSCLHQDCVLINELGSSETKTFSQYWIGPSTRIDDVVVPVGLPLPGKIVRVVDKTGRDCGVGEVGEIVVRMADLPPGYWQRHDLTRQHFPAGPDQSGVGSYRTGDRGRWRADGLLVHCGRTDWQCKIRGQKVELMEVEAALGDLAAINEAAVIAMESQGETRLIAYFTTAAVSVADSTTLHRLLSERLPRFMVPSQFIQLTKMPRMPNGKIDRKSLRLPIAAIDEQADFASPQTDAERHLAIIWADLFQRDQISRHDNFFQLGGHSLLAMVTVERLHRVGLQIPVSSFFFSSSLAEIAASAVSLNANSFAIPENRIPEGCDWITPEMLPLIDLKPEELNWIMRHIPGGPANIQDIYALTPLQEGILFHSRYTSRADPYTLSLVMRFQNRLDLDRYLEALQKVIDRHDTLRTAILWANLPEPAQVVQRKALLEVQELSISADMTAEDFLLAEIKTGRFRVNPTKAPLLRVYLVREEENERWLLLQVIHHLVTDQTATKLLEEEINIYLKGDQEDRPKPPPFRNIVARSRLGVSLEEHTHFFHKMLNDVEDSSLPFGLADVMGDSSRIQEARHDLSTVMERHLRARARDLGVSPVSLCHLAWALVVSRATGRHDVVFGTLLFGRLQGDAGEQRILGPCINTLPIRITLGEQTAAEAIMEVHGLLAELMNHEQAPLSLAQKASGMTGRGPLFSSLLNYRYQDRSDRSAGGSAVHPYPEQLLRRARSSYPLVLSVEDRPHGLSLRAQVQAPVKPERICRFMEVALQQLLDQLKQTSSVPIRELDVLPAEEHLQLVTWAEGPSVKGPELVAHQLFEQQAAITPQAEAIREHDSSLSYEELNRRANRLALRLRQRGVVPGRVVGVVVNGSMERVIALLAVFKAGGIYLPLDPALPALRQRSIADEARPAVILSSSTTPLWAGDEPVLRVATPDEQEADPCDPPIPPMGRIGMLDDPAYILYTSGSTGVPKGVVMPHRSLTNLLRFHCQDESLGRPARTLQFAAPGFDVSLQEILSTLVSGGTLVMLSSEQRLDPRRLWSHIRAHRVERLFLPPVVLEQLALLNDQELCDLRDVICAGEPLRLSPAIRKFFRRHHHCRLRNHYGPTESHVVTQHLLPHNPDDWPPVAPIGRPLPNTRIQLLDDEGRPCPIGAAGELHIGGEPLALGYLNRARETAELFIPAPCSEDPHERLYRSGDLATWESDGTLHFHGRIDHQIKLRGFRIEPAEIESALLTHSAVEQVCVLCREDHPGNRQLVAYWVPSSNPAPDQSMPGKAGAVPDDSPSDASLRAFLATSLPTYMLPSVFLKLKSFPLTPNGKLDRDALPSPIHTGERVVDAGTGIEKQLIQIWSDTLGRSDIGIHDNFFSLGGHSLTAAQVAASIEARFGHSLPVSALFEAQTVAELARRLGNQKAARSWNNLVPLQPKGAAKPLYMIHGGTGDVYIYLDLARALAPDRPVFGMQASGLDGSEPFHTSVEEMAAHYAALIRSFQPHGPYHLLGYSAGGWYAFAVAEELLRLGGEVGLLCMVDTGHTANIHTRLRAPLVAGRLLQRLPMRLQQLRRLKRGEHRDFFRERLKAIRYYLMGIRRASAVPVVGSSPTEPIKSFTPEHINPTRLVHSDYFIQIHTHYRPTPLPVCVEIIATGSASSRKEWIWSFYARNGVTIHPVLSEHIDFYDAEKMPELADLLRTRLDAVETAARFS